VIIAAILLISSVSILIYWSVADGGRRQVEALTMDPVVIGTSIEPGILIVQEMLERGKSSVSIEKVLADKDDYVCAITTSYGPMTLKAKDGKLRYDVVWGSESTTAYIIDNAVYRYSKEYGHWLKFDYDPNSEVATKPMTNGIMSESELLTKTDPEATVCVKAKIDEQDFIFSIEDAVDFFEVLEELTP